MRWHDNRIHERFIFRRVLWPSMEEAEEYTQITGGKCSDSYFADIRSTGSVDFHGSSSLDMSNLIRVYYHVEDSAGEVYEAPLITGFLTSGDTTHTDGLIEGSADISGMTVALSDAGPGYPYTASATVNAVDLVESICKSLNLKVSKTPSSFVLSRDKTFESGDSWLKIANALLSAAGYGAAYTDSWGTVQLQPYVEPTERTPVWTFKDDSTSTFKPSVKHSDNLKDTPNVVRFWYEDDSRGLYAEAKNNDSTSVASTVARGREIMVQEDVTELSGKTDNEMLEALIEKAKTKLINNSSEIEYVDIEGLFCPVDVGSCVTLDYTRAKMNVVGAITQRDVSFELGAPTTYRMRRLLRPSFVVEANGKVVWHV